MGRRVAVVIPLAVAALVGASPAQATFPGKNGAVAYVSYGSSGDEGDTSGIGLADGSGRDIFHCTLTNGVPEGGNCTATEVKSPSYSPDGRLIVFDAGERIAVGDATGRNIRLLPAVTSDDGSPAFSADGRRIIFTGERDGGGTDLYVRRPEGGTASLVVRRAG